MVAGKKYCGRPYKGALYSHSINYQWFIADDKLHYHADPLLLVGRLCLLKSIDMPLLRTALPIYACVEKNWHNYFDHCRCSVRDFRDKSFVYKNTSNICVVCILYGLWRCLELSREPVSWTKCQSQPWIPSQSKRKREIKSGQIT